MNISQRFSCFLSGAGMSSAVAILTTAIAAKVADGLGDGVRDIWRLVGVGRPSFPRFSS